MSVVLNIEAKQESPANVHGRSQEFAKG